MRVYILLTQTSSVITRIIKLGTSAPYNHASLAFDEQLEYTYSFGRLNPKDPLIGGFARESLNEGVFKDATCQLFSLKVTGKQYRQMRKRVSPMEKEQHKYKFNLLGMVASKFNIDLKRENCYFCSQFISHVLQEVGLFPEDFPPHLVAPHDLAKHVNLKLEYQGYLADYLQQSGFKGVSVKNKIRFRRRLFFLPMRVLFIPFKVVKVGGSTLKTGKRLLEKSRNLLFAQKKVG